jgi:hypothetical protein
MAESLFDKFLSLSNPIQVNVRLFSYINNNLLSDDFLKSSNLDDTHIDIDKKFFIHNELKYLTKPLQMFHIQGIINSNLYEDITKLINELDVAFKDFWETDPGNVDYIIEKDEPVDKYLDYIKNLQNNNIKEFKSLIKLLSSNLSNNKDKDLGNKFNQLYKDFVNGNEDNIADIYGFNIPPGDMDNLVMLINRRIEFLKFQKFLLFVKTKIFNDKRNAGLISKLINPIKNKIHLLSKFIIEDTNPHTPFQEVVTEVNNIWSDSFDTIKDQFFSLKDLLKQVTFPDNLQDDDHYYSREEEFVKTRLREKFDIVKNRPRSHDSLTNIEGKRIFESEVIETSKVEDLITQFDSKSLDMMGKEPDLNLEILAEDLETIVSLRSSRKSRTMLSEILNTIRSNKDNNKEVGYFLRQSIKDFSKVIPGDNSSLESDIKSRDTVLTTLGELNSLFSTELKFYKNSNINLYKVTDFAVVFLNLTKEVKLDLKIFDEITNKLTEETFVFYAKGETDFSILQDKILKVQLIIAKFLLCFRGDEKGRKAKLVVPGYLNLSPDYHKVSLENSAVFYKIEKELNERLKNI